LQRTKIFETINYYNLFRLQRTELLETTNHHDPFQVQRTELFVTINHRGSSGAAHRNTTYPDCTMLHQFSIYHLFGFNFKLI
jgi:hypothetical protein